jgi:diaminopimelate decarboxylase
LDVGAYGYAMASNYNSRPRPAEVLIQTNGEFRLIRKRDRLEDLLENQLAA